MLALLRSASGKAGRGRKGGEETVPRDIDFTMIYLVGHRQSGLRAAVSQAFPFKLMHHLGGAVLSPVSV